MAPRVLPWISQAKLADVRDMQRTRLLRPLPEAQPGARHALSGGQSRNKASRTYRCRVCLSLLKPPLEQQQKYF